MKGVGEGAEIGPKGEEVEMELEGSSAADKNN